MRSFLVGLFCTCLGLSYAQSDSLTQTDTVPVHSWKKAMLFSAIVPGSGQVYNHIAMPKGKKKAYWKVPLIYAGLGLTTYFAVNNNNMKNAYRKEIEFRVANGGIAANFMEYDQSGLETLFVQHRNRRDFAIVGIGLVYLLNVIDAGVEAHFVHFDVSKDLSFQMKPTVLSGYAPGLTLSFNFR